MVLSGVRPNAAEDGHVFRDAKLGQALWFGGVDDLWKLGKPMGQGGPWLDTAVKANVPSNPYLMRGYDQKTLTMSHRSSSAVNFKVEVDIDGQGHWVDYRSFSVAAGEELKHEFPQGFSACWIRASSDSETTATFQLEYR